MEQSRLVDSSICRIEVIDCAGAVAGGGANLPLISGVGPDRVRWWALKDLNLRPTDYESVLDATRGGCARLNC